MKQEDIDKLQYGDVIKWKVKGLPSNTYRVLHVEKTQGRAYLLEIGTNTFDIAHISFDEYSLHEKFNMEEETKNTLVLSYDQGRSKVLATLWEEGLLTIHFNKEVRDLNRTDCIKLLPYILECIRLGEEE